MARKPKQVQVVDGFKLDGHQRDHLRALAHRGDDKGLCDYVESLVLEQLPQPKTDSKAEG